MTNDNSIRNVDLKPFSLERAPSLIERLWPAQKISVEAQKERKAVQGQTLTALGSYWKGRKPLVLSRACVLGALLPATDNPVEDLAVFESLMLIDDDAFPIRDKTTKPSQLAQLALHAKAIDLAKAKHLFALRGSDDSDVTDEEFVAALANGKLVWSSKASDWDRHEVSKKALATLPYTDRVGRAKRPEEIEESAFSNIWPRVNRHLNTNAASIAELVQQLGEARFGRPPLLADTFAGSGSIPFEAARIGCDVSATDLNPVACMLTWASLNVVGGPIQERSQLDADQNAIIAEVAATIDVLGIEVDEHGRRAKTFLYCLEAICPSSGWRVPILPSLVISRSKRTIARLVPDYANRRYDIEIDVDVDLKVLANAEIGTLRSGYLVHEISGEVHRSSIKSIKGDERNSNGDFRSALRLWEKDDFTPRPSDVFQERLYCIQWIRPGTGGGKDETTFSTPTEADFDRERIAEDYVRANLKDWMAEGLIPSSAIEPGYNTDQPIRERGWTHWLHLFAPRQILHGALLMHATKKIGNPGTLPDIGRWLDNNNKLCRWITAQLNSQGKPLHGDKISNLFYNQALNTLYNYGVRSTTNQNRENYKIFPVRGKSVIASQGAKEVSITSDIYVTDPPYADAVHYHEITEFFIAWMRGVAMPPMDKWLWDSRRPLAIKGQGEEFRKDMVQAYQAMTRHMSDAGVHIVMFTHTSGDVWADMAQIFWGSGLQVQAAWYIATETNTELKKGGYVQGTVILVLRKRVSDDSGYEDEIAQEVRAEVARQIDTMVGLNQSLKGTGRIENLFEDADLQMAGYAAALRVLTGYTRIDGRDMTLEASRPRKKGEKSFVERIIEFAVQVANEHMVPEGLTPRLWQDLTGTERFYLKMVDLEAAGLSKLDNYQNFQRAFRVPDYSVLMADVRPNSARLKTAADFKRRSGFEIEDFGEGVVRAALYAIWELSADTDPDLVIEQLRGMVENYYRRREDMIDVAEYIATQRGRDDQREGRYAALLANLLRNERL